VNSLGATDFIVYATITVGSSTSSTLSRLIRAGDSGWFGLQLQGVTTANGSDPIGYTDASTLTLRAVGGTAGSGQLTTTVGAARAPFVIAATQQALTITSVTPSVVWPGGGTPITITGTGFVSGATVTIGAKPATNVILSDGSTLMAVTPEVPEFGDVTGDGKVELVDAVCTLRKAADLRILPVCNPIYNPKIIDIRVSVGSNTTAAPLLAVDVGDVTGDGKTELIDAVCILRQAADLRRLPACPPPKQ